MNHVYFMTVIDDVLCQTLCDKQIRGTFQSSGLTRVKLWAVITPQRYRGKTGHEIDHHI